MPYSHNTAFLSYIAEQKRQCETAKRAAIAEIEAARGNALGLLYAQRDDELEAHDRRVRRAIAAGIQGYIEAGRPTALRTGDTSVKECTSDFSCGLGYVCVKQNYSVSGYCARAVNQFGVQQFDVRVWNRLAPRPR